MLRIMTCMLIAFMALPVMSYAEEVKAPDADMVLPLEMMRGNSPKQSATVAVPDEVKVEPKQSVTVAVSDEVKVEPKQPVTVAVQVTEQASPVSKTTHAKRVYASFAAGVMLPDDNEGHVLTNAGTVRGEVGQNYSGILGYHVNDWLAVEANFMYSSFNFSGANGFGDTDGTLSASGDNTSYTLLENLIVSPFNWGRFRPYLGGGFGVMVHDMSLDLNNTANDFTITSSYQNSQLAFAAAGIVGMDYAVNPTFNIGMRYQYLWADTGKTIPGTISVNSVPLPGGNTLKTSNFAAQLITAQATYNF